jgi:8-oxo-dGTP pyrophosphatase MutT (NUDIX family)
MTRKIINAAGVLFFARSTNRQLFLLRNDKSAPTWSIPGGKVERNETLLETLKRECGEEIGHWPEGVKLFPIERYQSEDGHFCYHTFTAVLECEFTPTLNDEHIGYAWVDQSTYPRPLHRGLFSTLTYDLIQEKLAIIRSSID